MQRPTGPNDSRRRFLKLSGSALVLIPLYNLYGCSEKAEPPVPRAPAADPAQGGSASEPAPVPSTMPEKPALPATPADASAAAVELVRVDENDATAKALGYRHAAQDVDASKYPRYAAGQLCLNCSLYQPDAGADAGWGGCSIFPGKLVNANGWCSAYVPTA